MTIRTVVHPISAAILRLLALGASPILQATSCASVCHLLKFPDGYDHLKSVSKVGAVLYDKKSLGMGRWGVPQGRCDKFMTRSVSPDNTH